MSDDQVEKAITFLLDSQASLTAKLDALTGKVDANTGAIAALAADVKALTEAANSSFEVANKTAETVLLLADAQRVTTDQITRLASLLDRHVSNGHGGH